MFITALVPVLMMLSHQGFVPDLDMVLKPRAEACPAKTMAPAQFRLPTENNPHFSFEMLRDDERRKLKVLLRRPPQQPAFYLEKIKRQNRIFNNAKRYLVFGQLRADG